MRKTNIEFLVDLMEFSNHGPLAQIFVIEALYNYSKAVAASPTGNQVFGGFISEEAWRGCADEAIAKIDERFKEGS